jgi:hypothetical protein
MQWDIPFLPRRRNTWTQTTHVMASPIFRARRPLDEISGLFCRTCGISRDMLTRELGPFLSPLTNGNREVLIKVRAAGLNPKDWKVSGWQTNMNTERQQLGLTEIISLSREEAHQRL